MSIAPSFKAIEFGSLVILGGYALCTMLIGVLASFDAPSWSWVVLGLIAVLLAAISGFVGALFAKSNPLINGVFAGFGGASVLLSFLATIMPPGGRMAFVGPTLTVVVLAFGGALVAVYVWPRRGR
jgi:hypothetical protein